MIMWHVRISVKTAKLRVWFLDSVTYVVTSGGQNGWIRSSRHIKPSSTILSDNETKYCLLKDN